MIYQRPNILDGPIFFLKGFRLIFAKGYKKLFLLPVIFNTLIFFGLFYLLGQSGISLFNHYVGEYAWANFWLVQFVLWTLLMIIGFFIVNTCFVFCVNILAIPFHSMIAEKIMRDHQHPVNPLPSLWAEIKQTLIRELHKNLYFLPRLGFGLLLFVIPGINMIAPFVWLYFTAWIFGLQALDYAAELEQVSWKKALESSKKSPMLILGFGILQTLVVTLPILNVLTPPAAVAGGCFLWHQIRKHLHASTIEPR